MRVRELLLHLYYMSNWADDDIVYRIREQQWGSKFGGRDDEISFTGIGFELAVMYPREATEQTVECICLEVNREGCTDVYF